MGGLVVEVHRCIRSRFSRFTFCVIRNGFNSPPVGVAAYD